MKTRNVLALLLAALMILALCAGCGGKTEEPAAPAAEEPAAAAAEPAAGDDWAEYIEYMCTYARAAAPTEEAGATLLEALQAAKTWEDVTGITQTDMFFSTLGVLEYDAWIAAGKPAADTSSIPDLEAVMAASSEASGEATAEPAA